MSTSPSEWARDYWDRVALEKTFSHPLNLFWLLEHLPPPATLLDYGCGYGRMIPDLQTAGYEVYGVDFSASMIERGKKVDPELPIYHYTEDTWPVPLTRFDAICLFAVLTSLPDSADQRALIAHLKRRLKPGGLLYVSDILLQEDSRNSGRYARFEAEFGTYGIFRLGDGGVMRHHDRAYLLADLLGDFSCVKEARVEVRTMNGNSAQAFQCLLRLG